MKNKLCIALTVALAGLLSLVPLAQAQPHEEAAHHDAAQADNKDGAPNESDPKDAPKAVAFKKYPDQPSVTTGSVEINGQTVRYTATADRLTLVDAEGEPTGDIFYIAYRRTDDDGNAPDAGQRPITFSFNGGPGSSSVWLHLGLFGPKRVAYADEVGHPGPPPYSVIDNASSLLDVSDFVFIDPVSTGYSRAAGETDASDFHGLEPDIASVADFIRLYITREQRWRSPKFVAGESYGTTRAAGLSRELFERGIALNGVVLVSTVLDFATLRPELNNDLPYVMFLPTMAATAYYHGAVDTDATLEEHVAAAEAFAALDYATALLIGDQLPEGELQRVAERYAAYTGLDVQFVLDNDLRVSQPAFCKQLLRDESLTVGRLDSRFTGADRTDAGEYAEFDPSMTAILANYTGAFNAYVREDLGYETDLPYEILTGDVHPWKFDRAGQGQHVTVANRLRFVMHQLPDMQVFVACGLYDLATPHFAAEYTFNHMSLAPELRGNFGFYYYPAGHMMYVHTPSLERLSADLHAWYENVPVGGE